MADPLDADTRYVSLATRRRDGREVRTPVWLVRLGARYYVFSADDAGKVKRVRAQGQALLAPCSARGVPRGDWQAARARLVGDPALLDAVYSALRAKYGWQMRLLDWMSKLAGRHHRRAVIELELE